MHDVRITKGFMLITLPRVKALNQYNTLEDLSATIGGIALWSLYVANSRKSITVPSMAYYKDVKNALLSG